MLRLPQTIQACLFDLDGVLTDTAAVHARAWQQTFDAFLEDRARRTGAPFVRFDPVRDYDEYVDGRERYDGVRSFLASRGIEVDEHTVVAIGDRENDLMLELLRRDGVKVFDGSLQFVRAARAAGLRRGVVSASANCRAVLEMAGIAGCFEVRVDGVVARTKHLAGKPAPDLFLEAAKRLGVSPAGSAVFEDALAGVAAGRAGRFGLVVGVDRRGQAEALRAQGADVVVSDLSQLLEPE